MKGNTTLSENFAEHGMSRRGFLKYGAYLASLLALPPSAGIAMAEALSQARRQSVIWLSFQECTGCIESVTRAHSPTIEKLIFDFISLDYQHTLQAASGEAAEEARHAAIEENKGKYIVVVDGSIAMGDGGVYSTIAGITNQQMLDETVKHAAAVVAVGTCAAYGGLPMAHPNPTGAVPVSELISGIPLINVPGCPPIPEVIAGTFAHVLAFGTLPELDHLLRPLAFYGNSIHDRCYRRPFYDKGLFAETFDDEGAKKGWCLYKLGCKGPVTFNACATTKWNDGTSFPIEAGHGCLGCSEPDFWDFGGFYESLSTPTSNTGKTVAAAAAIGIAAGAGMGLANRKEKSAAADAHKPVTVDELNEVEKND